MNRVRVTIKVDANNRSMNSIVIGDTDITEHVVGFSYVNDGVNAPLLTLGLRDVDALIDSDAVLQDMAGASALRKLEAITPKQIDKVIERSGFGDNIGRAVLAFFKERLSAH